MNEAGKNVNNVWILGAKRELSHGHTPNVFCTKRPGRADSNLRLMLR